MRSLPYFRWFPADAETDHNYAALNDAELGLFHRLLNRSWINGGLPSYSTLRIPQSVLDRVHRRLGIKG
jgi:hypothetical protein